MNKNNYIKTEYNNPFMIQRADPYVYRHSDGSYYFTASLPEYDCIALRKSDSLDGLANAEETIVWRKHEEGIMSIHVWAPELHYLDDEWYIYFAAGDKDDIWEIRPYILHCLGSDPINDEWEEIGLMKTGCPFAYQDFSLDMTIFENKGVYYCVWAEKVSVGKKISNLYIARLKNPTELDSEPVLLSAPDFAWERVDFWVNEGPAVFHHDGKIYLTYSASATGACYCMGMLSISEEDEILNPRAWTKERYPVLETDAKKGMYGPGHNSFTTSEDGNDIIMIYHARQYDEIIGDPLYDPNRHAFRMKIKWDKDGKPIFDYKNNF